MRPCDLSRLGVEPHLPAPAGIPELTVRENLILAAQEHKGTMLTRLFGARDVGLTGDAEPDDRVLSPRACRRRTRPARCPTASRSCSTPRWRSMAGPRLVLLDEPAGGVTLTCWQTRASALGPSAELGGRDLRRHRARHGIRDGAVLAHRGAGGRAASSPRAIRRACAPIPK